MREPNKRVVSILAISFLAVFLPWGLASGVNRQDSLPQALPNRIAGGDMPLNLLEIQNRWIVSTNSGWHNAYLQVYDQRERKVSGRMELSSAWYGLAYDAGRKLLLASSGDSSIFVLTFNQGKLEGKRDLALESCHLPAGLELGDDGTAWVACNQNETLLRINYLTGKILNSVKIGQFPYAIRRLPSGQIAVSLWGQSAVAIVDGPTLSVVATIPVGSHPNDLLFIPRAQHLLVACSDSDDVSVIDVNKLSEVRRFHLEVPNNPLGGAQPGALSHDPKSGDIYVALSATNSVAVLRIKRGRKIEYYYRNMFAVGPHPTALLFSASSKALLVANGRNPVTGSNAPPGSTATKYPNIGSLIGGAIEKYPVEQIADPKKSTTLHRQVYETTRVDSPEIEEQIAKYLPANGKPSPIRYVFYILKENRTYDQILGDVPEGNGDPRLVLFGSEITPNQHALARDFILFDNFFVDGDVSADGHFWSMAATASDYVRRLWTTTYSNHADGAFDAPFDGDEEHDHPIAVPGSGFLWDRARKMGVTYRDYGEWGIQDKKDHKKDVVYLAGLKGHYDPFYRDAIGDVTDQERVDEWQKEFRTFEADGNLPQLSIIHLPNDHTCGTKPGYPTPRAMVADNDLALGRIIETISHSRFWAQSAIFVFEDDAQSGPDHVDAHRSPLLVISPYTRRRIVEHKHYQTASALKTMEQLLGLGSLTYFDDCAPSLLVEFRPDPLPEVYNALVPGISLHEMNTPDSPGAKESARWDFTHPDRAPEMELNKVIWQSVQGQYSSLPPPITQVRLETQ